MSSLWGKRHQRDDPFTIINTSQGTSLTFSIDQKFAEGTSPDVQHFAEGTSLDDYNFDEGTSLVDQI